MDLSACRCLVATLAAMLVVSIKTVLHAAVAWHLAAVGAGDAPPHPPALRKNTPWGGHWLPGCGSAAGSGWLDLPLPFSLAGGKLLFPLDEAWLSP